MVERKCDVRRGMPFKGAAARGVYVAPNDDVRMQNGRPRQPTPLAGTPKGMPPAGGRGHLASEEHPWASEE